MTSSWTTVSLEVEDPRRTHLVLQITWQFLSVCWFLWESMHSGMIALHNGTLIVCGTLHSQRNTQVRNKIWGAPKHHRYRCLPFQKAFKLHSFCWLFRTHYTTNNHCFFILSSIKYFHHHDDLDVMFTYHDIFQHTILFSVSSKRVPQSETCPTQWEEWWNESTNYDSICTSE